MLFLMNLAGYVFDWKYISVLATIEEVNDFEVQNKLLKDTFEEVGVSMRLRLWYGQMGLKSEVLHCNML